MPYYKGMSGEWADTMREVERITGSATARWITAFRVEPVYGYVEPWQAKTTVLQFPATPGPEPEIAQDAGVLEEMREAAVHALWEVSTMTATCRNLGVKRVFGSYDGGGDESFTHYQGVEMSDGRVVPASLALRTMADSPHGEPRGMDYEDLVENAVSALMGRFGIGPYTLHGVVIIDFDVCTITDEKKAHVVFGEKKPWEV